MKSLVVCPDSGRLIQHASFAGSAVRWIIARCAVASLLAGTSVLAQVTVDRQGNVVDGDHPGASVDRRFAQIDPTHVDLAKTSLDPKTRLEVIRLMTAEQGFAMRPFPKGHKGLTLVANGKLDPAGEPYLAMITSAGTSAKPGDRLVLTDVKIDKTKIIFDLNGGPDHKHAFLRHIQIGTGGSMSPVVQNSNDPDPTGARLTLDFKGPVPELTGAQVKALLAPLISFDVKTPIQAFTDTLPPKLKDAILNHHVIVGMSTEMVLFAKGQPGKKVREMEGQMPFEEWIYGQPPKDVEFVRINGNRVIRLEIAKVGEKPAIFDKDEVEGLMRTDGTPALPAHNNTRTVAIGDVERDPTTQAPAAPPTLRDPGETLPQDDPNSHVGQGANRPVQFPKQKTDDYPDASNLPRDPKAAEAGQADAPDTDSTDESQPAQSGDSQTAPKQQAPAKPH
jgi:hypothetical protein